MQPDTWNHTLSGTPRIALGALLLASLVSGCGSREAQFSSRAEVQELMPEARHYVHEVLAQNFGTPTNSVAWERMPIRFHAATGSIAEVGADGTELTLAPPAVEGSEEEPSPGALQQWLPIRADEYNSDGGLIFPGLEVLVVSGTVLDQMKKDQSEGKPAAAVRVKSYDDITRKVVLTGPLAATPQAGERVILGPGEILKTGRVLYAEHCQHCHGVAGDGAGPTAQYLNPLPRDYRSAIFKFTSTKTPERAQRHDLAHIIEEGIPGTYMPSFKLLKSEESTAIVEYVLWLSCRGESELRRSQALINDFSSAVAGEDPQSAKASFAEAFTQFATDFDDEATQITEAWQAAQLPDAVVVPTVNRTSADAASIARGREIFKSDTAKCATCHGEAGKGDGPQTLAVQKDKAGKDRDVPGLFDDWNHPIKPRDLTTGIYRGGRRPVDIYRRIYAGIKGTPMTGFGTSLSEAQIWDLVNYVMSIPFEHRGPGKGPFVPTTASEDPGVGIQDSGVAQATPDSNATDKLPTP